MRKGVKTGFYFDWILTWKILQRAQTGRNNAVRKGIIGDAKEKRKPETLWRSRAHLEELDKGSDHHTCCVCMCTCVCAHAPIRPCS